MRNKIKMILFVSFIWLFGNCTSSSKKETRDNIKWKETIGYFDPRRYKGGKIVYNSDSEQITVSYGYMTDVCFGLKYSMRYNINDPHEYEIDYWNPVFEEGEQTFYTIAKITGFQFEHFYSKGNSVLYYYFINGKKKKKWAYMPPNFRILYPNLAVGQCYRLEYWSENANRNKIHLDKPVKCEEVVFE